jgi:hypothetical protein
MRRLVPLIGSLQSLTDHYVTSFFTQPDSPATLPTPHPMYKARVRQLVQHRSRGIAEVILQKKPREDHIAWNSHLRAACIWQYALRSRNSPLCCVAKDGCANNYLVTGHTLFRNGNTYPGVYASKPSHPDIPDLLELYMRRRWATEVIHPPSLPSKFSSFVSLFFCCIQIIYSVSVFGSRAPLLLLF